ncbi:MAG: TetR/AcrR family transcriptional regulator [Caldilineaceae bacterium]
MMGEERKSDRRSARSQQLLHRALLELMQEKRYDKITIQDIIDRADLGRSTFYAHYRDKEDLLVSNFERMLEGFSAHWLPQASETTTSTTHQLHVAALFHHAREFHDLYQALVWGRGIELIYKQAQHYLRKRVEEVLQTMVATGIEPQMPLPLLANHIAATLGTLLRWWLEAGMPYTPEEMDHYFHQLIAPVVEQVMAQDAVSNQTR